jgi:hypothetical protein
LSEGVDEIDPEWKAERYMKKAYNIEQVALKASEHSYQANKSAIQQRNRIEKDPTHSQVQVKVVFRPGHEEMRDGLIGESLTLSQIHRNQGTVFRSQEDLTASQHKMYKDV